MNVTFDQAKDAANLAKHGVSLTEAAGFEWGTAVVWPDTRRDYGEARMVAPGLSLLVWMVTLRRELRSV